MMMYREQRCRKGNAIKQPNCFDIIYINRMKPYTSMHKNG